MKRVLLLLGILGWLTPMCRGGAGESFAAANRLYADGQYTQALEAYSRLADEISNWKLEYNMGNCCVKLERFVEAKIHYLRALRLAPTRRIIRENLAYADERMGHTTLSSRPGFLLNLWQHFSAWVPLNVISFLLIVAVFLLNAFLILLLWRGRRRWRLYGLGFSLAAALSLAALEKVYTHRADLRDTAVVTRSEARLRSGPGREHTVLFTLRSGLDVRILESREQWLQVAAGEDVAGWIEAAAVETI